MDEEDKQVEHEKEAWHEKCKVRETAAAHHKGFMAAQ